MEEHNPEPILEMTKGQTVKRYSDEKHLRLIQCVQHCTGRSSQYFRTYMVMAMQKG